MAARRVWPLVPILHPIPCWPFEKSPHKPGIAKAFHRALEPRPPFFFPAIAWLSSHMPRDIRAELRINFTTKPAFRALSLSETTENKWRWRGGSQSSPVTPESGVPQTANVGGDNDDMPGRLEYAATFPKNPYRIINVFKNMA